MFRRGIVSMLGVALLVIGLSLPALACDENHGSKIKIQAPIEDIVCDSTSSTVTLLGLTIDISTAKFEGDREHDGKDLDKVNCEDMTCADLTVGQVVKVELFKDPTTDALTATEIEIEDCDDDGVKISAPIENVSANTVTVLGSLVINITDTTKLMTDEGEPITAAQLKTGQFARITLPDATSRNATKIKVHIDEIKIQAPIEDIVCDSTSSTVTLLGLTIDISTAKFEGDREHDGKDLDKVNCEDMTCADLTVGQMVKVELVSDIPIDGIFKATEIEREDCDDDEVKITAPLQSIDPIDPNAFTVTVLGSLIINISGATITDDNDKPINAVDLIVGQYAEIDLDSTKLPSLYATRLEAQDPISQVQVKLLDKKGKPLTAVGNVKADVTIKGVKKTLGISAAGNGTFQLASLPAGKAKIVVTHVLNGQTSKASASVKVKTRQTQQVNLRLKPVK
jgi:hypothetical protein